MGEAVLLQSSAASSATDGYKRSSGEPRSRPQVSPHRAAVRYCYSIFLFSMAERQQTAFAGAAAPSITTPKHNQCAQFQKEAVGNEQLLSLLLCFTSPWQNAF